MSAVMQKVSQAAASAAAHFSSLPSTMKAGVVPSPGAPYEIRDVPVPKPAAGQILVKVHKSGVCHTEVHISRGELPKKPKSNLITGHEGAGEVVSIGDGVNEVKVGDRVGVIVTWQTCGQCEYCCSGWESLCPELEMTGMSQDGAHAEYVLAWAHRVVKLPDQLSYSQCAPIMCAGTTVYKALKESEARAGQWVVIYGAGGGLGHLCIQYALAMGLKPVAIDTGADKKALCMRVGACHFIDAKEQDVEQEVNRITGCGPQASIMITGYPASFTEAVHTTRRGGYIVLVAIPEFTYELPIFDVVFKRLTIRGSQFGSILDVREALQFAVDGKVHTDVTEVPLEQLPQVVEKLRCGEIAGRVVLDFEAS